MKQNTTAQHKCKETIRGVVVPAQWDDQFQVTDMLIACRSEREVRIGNLASFPILKSLFQAEAIVVGIVEKHDGNEIIMIETITPIGKGQGES